MPRPAAVMPSPWGDIGWLAYAVQGTRLALRGYNVLAYTAGGFGKSGGQIDLGGPQDWQDGSAAVDFVMNQGPGTVTGVGFLGDSYGSGISQLVAAHDDRVNAVVGMSTWGDLGEAFYENGTVHVASVKALQAAAQNARLSDETKHAFEDVLANRDVEETLDWAALRSPTPISSTR